ncbi:MAG: diguanylate cyclase (GGDEF)-like protein [Pseudohongiellaceae bacterium]
MTKATPTKALNFTQQPIISLKNMKKFLLVEDSQIVVKIIKHINDVNNRFQYDTATSFAEAKVLIDQNGADSYLVAVVDLNLPDAPNGEVVDYTLAKKMPTIVLTGNYDENKREQMLDKKIVDYIVKESRFSYEYVMKLIHRLHKNQNIKILVADDSKVSRNYVKGLLKTHLYQIITVDDGDTALEAINSDPDIKLLITDYNMPRMNGFDLVKNIRREVSKNDLVIIGLSGEGDGKLTAKFIKNGANDFLSKPFSHEEFHCRLMHNIESIEYGQTMKHMAYHDYVTGLPNKRTFFEQGSLELAKAQTGNANVSLALISVDKLLSIQDKYGLNAPDLTLQSLAELMPKAFGRFHYARISDSDVAVLMIGLTLEQAAKLTEGFREIVEDHIVFDEQLSFNFTISAGITASQEKSLIELLKDADNRLYTARDSGENQVCFDE